MAPKSKAVCMVGLILVVCLVLGFWARRELMRKEGSILLRPTGQTSSKLIVDPPRYEFTGYILEHDTSTTTFVLRNDSKDPAVIRSLEFPPSMAITVTDGNRAVMPIHIPPSGSMALKAHVKPVSLWGKQELALGLDCEVGGVKTYLEAKLQFVVSPGPRAFPEKVVMAEKKSGFGATETVKIYDAYPDPGVAYADVVVSDPNAIRFELKRIPPEQSGYDATKSRFGFRHRYTLELYCTVPVTDSKWYHYSVQLVPKDNRTPPLIIPITGRVRPAEFAVSPSEVIIYLPQGERSARRTILCQFPKDIEVDLTILKAPKFVNAELSKSETGQYQIEIQCSLPPDHEGSLEGEIHVGVGTQQRVVVRVPVKIYTTSRINAK